MLLLSRLDRISKKIYRKGKYLYKFYVMRDEFLVSIKKWQKDCGDVTRRLDYPELDSQSIVFDLGGYKGDFSFRINQKYNCKIYLFEPHPEFYEYCRQRFLDNDNIVVLNYGLSDTNGAFFLSNRQDGSSFINPQHATKEGLKCHLRKYSDVFDELKISCIDLMKINIEGGEYSLLEHIIYSNRQSQIKQYQIQFHNFIDHAVRRRSAITSALSSTHIRTWCYPFVWENWRAM